MTIDVSKISRIEVFNFADNKHRLGILMSAFKGLDYDVLDFQIQEDGKTLKIYLGSDKKEPSVNKTEGDE